MLFMVVEHFKNGEVERVRERFDRAGRMLPEGVIYHMSWVDPAQARCFQVMEAANQEALTGWTEKWRDLVEFEIVPVVTSQEYWAGTGQRG
jgi:hypothetical protein